MPEGDTVWRVARTLHRALAGTRVTTEFRVPQLATTKLVGTVIESASALTSVRNARCGRTPRRCASTQLDSRCNS